MLGLEKSMMIEVNKRFNILQAQVIAIKAKGASILKDNATLPFAKEERVISEVV